MLKPAPPDPELSQGTNESSTGISGVRDVSGKILGTKNKISNVYATLKALETITYMDKLKARKFREMAFDASHGTPLDVLKELSIREVE